MYNSLLAFNRDLGEIPAGLEYFGVLAVIS